MSLTITTFPQLSYHLREYVQMQENDDGLVVTSPFFQITIAPLKATLRYVMMALAEKPRTVRWLNETIHQNCQANREQMVLLFYRYLSSLMRHQMLALSADHPTSGALLATLLPISRSFQHILPAIQQNQPYQLSRFSYIRREEDGLSYLESPLSHARLCLHSVLAASTIYHLGKTITPPELAQLFPEEASDTIGGLLSLLIMGNFLTTTSARQLSEAEDETLRQWDFHDLLFHSRSRMGRHSNPIGGTYRFLHQLLPQPAIKQAQWPGTISLPVPDMDRIVHTDPRLSTVMAARTSIRNYDDDNPITLSQLGEFLYRVAHVEDVYHTDETGDLTKRPYPNGGASYEMELYLTVEHCDGLASGFYWYNPLQHALAFIREPNKDTDQLLADAYQSTGGPDRPQILITLAARFQRISWKYQGLAYALILKDVGVIYSTMYLVATAMKLAPCALGVGDSDCFARAAGTDYLKETSVGEFTLGSKLS